SRVHRPEKAAQVMSRRTAQVWYLAELLRIKGEVLLPVYEKFTDGLAATDMRAARALLDALPTLVGNADATLWLRYRKKTNPS
ncbi:MAG TPA: hypothetical protein VHX39_32175, partial [Acetobacteraceae bacterium]|nr:hypothetical protein [Acetobacteraceae bacterium]